MGEEEYIKIAKRVNVHNFYGFMDSYNLTHGELLGIINYGIHSDISKFQKENLYQLLHDKQCILRLTDSKLGIIADTHIGSPFMSWDKIYRAYDFFFEHNIHTVILLGDLFHGPSYRYKTNPNRGIIQCYQQFVDCEEHYPKGFQNFVLHGNHEERFQSVGMNLWEMLAMKRDDFFSLGIGRCYVEMNGFIISLNHPGTRDTILPPEMDCDISLYAHYHYFKKRGSQTNIGTCSNLVNQNPSPGIDTPGFAILYACNNKLRLKAYDLSDDDPKLMFTESYSKIKKR